MSKAHYLSDDSNIPLKWMFGLMASIFSVMMLLISSVVYVSKIEAKADNATQMLSDTNKELDHIKKTWQTGISDLGVYLRSIDQRLSKIEGRLEGDKNGTRK